MSRYLGINLSHNGSVAVVEDGAIVFYLEEERLTKVKRMHGASSVVSVALEKYPTFDSVFFNGTVSYTEQINEIATLLAGHPKTIGIPQNFVDHHAAHALSAYYTSPFDGEDALLLVIDGAGENVADGFFETESIFRFTKDSAMEAICKRYGTNENAPDFFIPRYKATKQLVGENCDLVVTPFAHITKTYEAICTYLGYPDHEAGKIMGLAPYGQPTTKLLTESGYGVPEVFACKYPGYARVAYLGLDPERLRDDRLSDGENQIQPECDQWVFDLAASIQHDTQHAVLKLLQKYIQKTGIRNVCTAGGYSLNSICNQFLVDSIPGLKLWSMPVAHDGGVAIGCAYAGHDSNPAHHKKVVSLNTLSLGNAYSVEETMLREFAQSNFLSLLSVAKMDSASAIALAAKYLSENQSIAWHLGGSEAGPRALGHRSILSDPRDAKGRDRINKMKGREWYRPLAGTCLAEHFDNWFETAADCRFMMYVCPSKQKDRIPAMVHIDGTCRVQSLSASDNPKYHALISRFFDLTGVPTVLNTSYNAGGEPLCETPLDSLNTFAKMSKLKALFIFDKDEETCFVVSRETVQTDDELEIEAARRKAQRQKDREAYMRKVKEANGA